MKPLLVGEANPYGGDPYYALYPAPDGCSGHRLCCLILGMARHDYLEVFDRINLCPHRWNMREARQRAETIWTGEQAPRVILCGSKVATAWQVPFVPFEISEGGTVLVLPHPSGLCRLWAQRDSFRRARTAVKMLCPEIAHLIGEISRT
jgi:hypothetical protein